MTQRDFNKCMRRLSSEKDDKNVVEITVDFENMAIRCDEISTYVGVNGITYNDLAIISYENFTITIVNKALIKNIRYTDRNQETFPILV